jgi:prepilin-type N-terminal cleavage/methylation domain-containing protein
VKGRSRKAGFTLVECVVTVFLLGVGVVGVASMFIYANLSERKAAHMDQARNIAEQALEQVRAQGYGVFTDPSGSVPLETPGLPRATGVLAWQPYPTGAPEQGLKLVAVNLAWDSAGSSSGRYQLTTLVSKPEGG